MDENAWKAFGIAGSILGPVLAFLGATWASGYRIGLIRGEIKASHEALQLKQSQQDALYNSLNAAVCTLEKEDCLTEEDLDKVTAMSEKLFKGYQAECAANQDHKRDLMLQTLKQNSQNLAALAEDVRLIKEALLRKQLL